MKFTEFIKQANLRQLLILFFNIKFKENYILIEGSFKTSKHTKIELTDEIYENFKHNLTKHYEIEFKQDKTTTKFILENDFLQDKEKIYKAIYNKIIIEAINNNINEVEKEIVLSLFLLRGSADPTTKYMAVDVLKENSNEIYYDLMFKILILSDNLISRLNLNFRELQEQFITGERQRNTQIRLCLSYLVNHYLEDFNNIHQYKGDILQEYKKKNEPEREMFSFYERLQFYKNKIIDKDFDYKKYRQELGFENIEQKITRNISIVNFVKETQEDKCFSCSKQYDLKDRSFKLRSNNRFYLEIHHIIPFSNDKEQTDVAENLVKLCPTCHKALTKNRASEVLQKQIITNILEAKQESKEFVADYSKEQDLVSYIYERLA